MATVWAAREDAFKWGNEPKKTGWSHSFTFGSLSDLFQQMRNFPSLVGKVTKLAIVAHGDKQGQVKLDRLLNPDTATTFRQDFAQLDPFLSPYARLIFYSCIAGADLPGSKLLNIISGQFLPRRHIIGFEVFGGVGPGGTPRFAGQISAIDRLPPSGPRSRPAPDRLARSSASTRGTRSGPSAVRSSACQEISRARRGTWSARFTASLR